MPCHSLPTSISIHLSHFHHSKLPFSKMSKSFSNWTLIHKLFKKQNCNIVCTRVTFYVSTCMIPHNNYNFKFSTTSYRFLELPNVGGDNKFIANSKKSFFHIAQRILSHPSQILNFEIEIEYFLNNIRQIIKCRKLCVNLQFIQRDLRHIYILFHSKSLAKPTSSFHVIFFFQRIVSSANSVT